MKEIKFRAWYCGLDVEYMPKGKECMCRVLSIELNEEALSIDPDPFDDLVDLTEVILMQYIGSFDKNHKNIFEEDILISKDGLRKHIVKYDNRFAQYYRKGIGQAHDERFITHADWDEYEIIGNVYENPELLK